MSTTNTSDDERFPREALRCWSALSEKIERETDDRTRANLETVRRHCQTEWTGDLDAVMATMVPEPQHIYFSGMGIAPLAGHDAVRAGYQKEADEGRRHIFDLSRVIADHDSVTLEGIMLNTTTGARLLASRRDDVSGLDPSEWYVLEQQMLVVLPMSPEGLIQEERVYFGGDSAIKGVRGPEEQKYLGSER